MLISEGEPLQVGDAIRIVCPERPALCVDRRVGSDGTVDLPGIGAFPAALKTPTEFARSIAQRTWSDLTPVRIEVRRLGFSPDEISITGSVGRPLRIFAPHGVALDRLLEAAAVLPEADRTLIPTSIKVRPGTSLTIPSITADRRISVLGGVANPSALAPSNDLTLGRALDAAGGLTVHADRDTIVVVRNGEALPRRMPADASYPLRPGDVVRVALVADRRFVVVKGLVTTPGTVEFITGLTIGRALRAAGGVLPSAQSGTVVWQTGPKTFRLSVAFLLSGRIVDPVLGPDDTIVIEAAKP